MTQTPEEYLATIEGMKLKIAVLSDGRIAVNQLEHAFDFVQTVHREYSLLLDGKSFQISVAEAKRNSSDSSPQQSYSITLNGRVYLVEVDNKRSLLLKSLSEGERTSSASSTLHSPMPGLVVKVEVHEGEEVKMGQGLIVLEAMKMENELKASGKGKVTAIHVSAGHTVEKGEKLITLSTI